MYTDKRIINGYAVIDLKVTVQERTRVSKDSGVRIESKELLLL